MCHIYSDQPIKYKSIITYYTSLYHLLTCHHEYGERFSITKLNAKISAEEILSSMGLSLDKYIKSYLPYC